MKRFLLSALLSIGISAPALADNPLASIPTPTHDWGCEVLLCLANPQGPTAVAPCEPPIRRLWSELARGRPFPSCSMATGPAGRSYAQPGYSYYDECPNGTSELEVGEFAELATPMNASVTPSTRSGAPSTYTEASTGYTYGGIGAGGGYGVINREGPPPAKVCVAGLQGYRNAWNGEDYGQVGLYDTIFVSPAQGSPRIIDVYIDNTKWHRVRW